MRPEGPFLFISFLFSGTFFTQYVRPDLHLHPAGHTTNPAVYGLQNSGISDENPDVNSVADSEWTVMRSALGIQSHIPLKMESYTCQLFNLKICLHIWFYVCMFLYFCIILFLTFCYCTSGRKCTHPARHISHLAGRTLKSGRPYKHIRPYMHYVRPVIDFYSFCLFH